jgi:hypothetical protein
MIDKKMIVEINNHLQCKNYNQSEKVRSKRKAYRKVERKEMKKFLTNKNKNNLLWLANLYIYMILRIKMIQNKKNSWKKNIQFKVNPLC